MNRANAGAGDAPIAGLYAVGTDLGSIFCGSYPGSDANPGPAMTFGFLCTQHIGQTGGSGSKDK